MTLRTWALLLTTPAVVGAQGVCRAEGDSATASVTLTVVPFDDAEKVPEFFRSSVELELAMQLQLPQPLALSTYVVASDDLYLWQRQRPRAVLGIAGLYSVILRRDGKNAPARTLALSGVPEFDNRLTAALDSVTQTGRMWYPPTARSDTLVLRAIVETSENPKNATVLATYKVARAFFDSLSGRPAFQRGMPMPRYPDDLRRRGEGGDVVVRYIMDTTGAVVPGSVRYLMVSHAGFAESVANFLPEQRFRPFRLQGCAVPVVVSQPFNFQTIP